jgi:asparagine synthase (glutamine-hydrolysing)
MCGIAGIVDLAGRPLDPALVHKLCAELGHRGPDEEGYYVSGQVALGQRRLAILDVTGGRQPMSNDDGSVWVTFNGEIYNFQELRRDLEKFAYRFATRSDTEVIVHAYEAYGTDCVKQFRGMFAFALWDQRAQTLFLARDRVGKKPLFYADVEGQWTFASELQALLQHPRLSREVDWTALDDYLTYGYVPAPKTAFKGIWKLPPAHFLTLRIGKGSRAAVHTERYWHLEYEPKLKIGEKDAAEGLLEVLTEAVRLRMIADVPLGALLSGGIDSSIVVALMSQLSKRPVKTFSIGFEEQAFNELPYARLVAERYATEHHEFMVRPNALEILPTLVRHYGEPYADSSAIPTYYVAKATRGHVKVALNGDGGDECFAGYDRYLGSRLAERYHNIPAAVRKLALEPLGRLIPNSMPRRNRLRQVKSFLQVAGEPASRRYLRWIAYFSSEQKRALYAQEFQQQLASYDADRWLLEMWEQVTRASVDPLDAVLSLDMQSYLPNDLLVKMDIATMANSLEARSPFLDHKVMEFCASLPSSYKLRRLTHKYLLKKTGARLLPSSTLRRRKMGFGVPIGSWMRGELRSWVEDLLLSPRALNRGYFEPAALRRLVQAHMEGEQHPFGLWALLWLELWHREFMD